MLRFPRWNWKSSHFSKVDQQSRPASLPRIEQLDPRVLLSVSQSDIVVVKQVDKSSTTLAIAEASLFDGIKGESQDDKHKGEIEVLSNDLLKLNSVFLKYDTDILNQKISKTEGSDVSSAVNDIFLKVEGIASDLGTGDNSLLPAVQKIFDDALGTNQNNTDFPVNLLGDLTTLANSDLTSISGHAADGLIKMAGDLWKMNETVVGFKVDLARGTPADVALKQATDKWAGAYLKLQQDEAQLLPFLDPKDALDLSNTIDALKIEIGNAISPPVIGATFTGGVTVPGGSGDTIS